MPQKTADELWETFVADWNAALNPCIACLLDACPPDDRQALAERVRLTDLPTPPYSPVQHRRLMEKVATLLERIERDPGVVAANDQRDAQWRDTPWLKKRWLRLRFWLRWQRPTWQRGPLPWE